MRIAKNIAFLSMVATTVFLHAGAVHSATLRDAGDRCEALFILAAETANASPLEQLVERAEVNLRVSGLGDVADSFDVIAVGGGPQTLMFMARLKALRPDLKLLIIEATANLGTYHKLGGTFRLNSQESDQPTGNTLWQLPIQPRTLSARVPGYIEAEAAGRAILMNYVFLDVPIAFQQRVSKVSRTSPSTLEVTTAQGLKIRAKVVVQGVGLGVPRLNSVDAETAALLQASMSASNESFARGETGRVPFIEPVDHALTRAKLAGRKNQNPLQPYAGKDVVIIGKSDGKNIAVEFLLGTSPIFDGFSKEAIAKSLPRKVTIIGPKETSFEAFAAAEFGQRYVNVPGLREAFDSGRIEILPGRWHSAEPTSRGRTIFAYEDAAGQARNIEADFGIAGVGYSKTDPAFESSQQGRVPVFGTFADPASLDRSRRAIIAYQTTANGANVPVYTIGMATGMDVDNGLKLNEVYPYGSYVSGFGLRSVALADKIARDLPRPENSPTTGTTRSSFKGHTKPIRPKLPTDLITLGEPTFADYLEAKIEIAQRLLATHFPPNRAFTLRLEQIDNTTYLTEATKRARFISKREPSKAAKFLSNHGNNIALEFETDPQGLPMLHTLSIQK